MKKLAIAAIVALSIATFGSVNSYANEAGNVSSQTVTTEQAEAVEALVQAKLDSGISLETAIQEVLASFPDLLLAVSKYAANQSIDVDTFQSLAISAGLDVTQINNVTEQYAAAGPGLGAENGNAGNIVNNGVGRGQGNGRANNRGNGNGAGGGGGDCGISEQCNN